MADINDGMLNLALQPQPLSYLHYHNAYVYETSQGGDLLQGAPTY